MLIFPCFARFVHLPVVHMPHWPAGTGDHRFSTQNQYALDTHLPGAASSIHV